MILFLCLEESLGVKSIQYKMLSSQANNTPGVGPVGGTVS